MGRLRGGRGQLGEEIEAAGQGGVVDGVGDAEVGVASAEDVAGDDQEIAPDGRGDEFGRGPPRGAREGVEGAFRMGELEGPGEGGRDRIALALAGFGVSSLATTVLPPPTITTPNVTYLPYQGCPNRPCYSHHVNPHALPAPLPSTQSAFDPKAEETSIRSAQRSRCTNASIQQTSAAEI